MKIMNSIIEQCRTLLAESGVTPLDNMAEQLDRLAALIREANMVLSLVSAKDARHLEDRHIADALSLVPWVLAYAGPTGSLLDIGSGGGFPALPIKVVIPGLQVTLVERSVKKVGFLRRAVGALGLTGVTVLHGEYPKAGICKRYDVITARAVEKPDRIFKAVLAEVAQGAVFMSQSGNPGTGLSDMFHVELIHDAWTAAGLRRGPFRVIRRA